MTALWGGRKRGYLRTESALHRLGNNDICFTYLNFPALVNENQNQPTEDKRLRNHICSAAPLRCCRGGPTKGKKTLRGGV